MADEFLANESNRGDGDGSKSTASVENSTQCQTIPQANEKNDDSKKSGNKRTMLEHWVK